MEVTVSNTAIEIPLQKADADTRMSKRCHSTGNPLPLQARLLRGMDERTGH